MSSEKQQPQIIVIKKPSTLGSILEDTYTFGGFIAVMWFNHTYMSGNGWLDALLIVMWTFTVAAMQSRRTRRFESPADAIAWLGERK